MLAKEYVLGWLGKFNEQLAFNQSLVARASQDDDRLAGLADVVRCVVAHAGPGSGPALQRARRRPVVDPLAYSA